MASPIVTLTWTKDGDQTSQNVTLSSGGAHQHVTDTVPASTTDRQVNCAIDVSGLQGIYILADGDLALEANSGSAADYTLTITGDKPFVWYKGSGITNPLTDDTTEFYVTNAGGSEVTLDIYVEQDPTP